MKRLFSLLALVTCLLNIANSTFAQLPFAQPSPKYEFRAVWLTTIGGIDWPHSYYASQQKAELSRILDQLKAAGINTVFLQTRVRATTIYPSAIEPWDGCITGKPGHAASYDPLKLAIDECHKRGMQLHAWVVTIPVGKWQKYGCAQLRKQQPKMLIKIGEEGYMNPERPETADYLARMCREIVSNYDVDGIHLDYIRYPETWRQRLSRPEGRAHITNIVRRIYRDVKAVKPWVMLSCSPIGKHDDLLRYRSNGWNARTRVCQDAQQWLREGIMDALFPMMYFRANNFFPFAIDWAEHAYGRYVVPGLGIYFLDPSQGSWTIDEVERQMNVVRSLGMGHCFFRSKFLTDDVQGIYHFTQQFNSTPALIPPMYWQQPVAPKAPSWLVLEKDATLSWQAAEKGMVYNVYASGDYPVDVSKAEHLLVTRWCDNHLVVDANQPLNYAVTVQDRYGVESEPVQLMRPHYTDRLKTVFDHPRIAKADQTIVLPPKPLSLDADFLVIETLQGSPVAVIPYHGVRANVSHLPEGVYQWRSLGRKGRNHRLGFFSVKHH